VRDISQDIVGVPAEIRNEHLSNTNLDHHIYTNPSGMKMYKGAGAQLHVFLISAPD
jgi:hypothetical protein